MVLQFFLKKTKQNKTKNKQHQKKLANKISKRKRKKPYTTIITCVLYSQLGWCIRACCKRVAHCGRQDKAKIQVFGQLSAAKAVRINKLLTNKAAKIRLNWTKEQDAVGAKRNHSLWCTYAGSFALEISSAARRELANNTQSTPTKSEDQGARGTAAHSQGVRK